MAKVKEDKLSIEDISLIIKLLEDRRVYFESRNRDLAIQCSRIISKLQHSGIKI